ncbi:MAG: hypothetical protein HY867_18405 [Chloroflexi bacterium]|nr:hypothetical protein [Chloroflexota bacterium]
MSSWAYLFDKRGHILDEFDGVFRRSWAMNAEGECRFTLPINDRKNTLNNFQFGNHIVVLNNDGLPPWSGRLTTPRSWGNKTNKHFARSHAAVWDYRIGKYTLPYVMINQAGVIARHLLEVANLREDTLIRPGKIHYGGHACGAIISPAKKLQAFIDHIVKQSGHEWEIAPVINNNKLILYLNWYDEIGVETGASLNDSNCRIDENSLQENGPIYNLLLGIGTEQEVRNHHLAINRASQDMFGLYEMPYEVDAVEAVAVKALTEEQLAYLSWPRRAFRATASKVNDFYKQLRIGNRAQFESAESGYGARGRVGTQAEVRILGMAYTDDADGVALTII